MAEHRGAVYRFALRLTKNQADAEDVLQDTFLHALRALDAYSGTGTVRGWLFSIARNRVLMGARRRSGEPAVFEPMEALEDLGLRAGWGAGASPERLVAQAEQAEALSAALDRLPEDERAVLALRDIEGLSGDETARALDLTVAAMKSRLHRARLRLIAQLSPGGEP